MALQRLPRRSIGSAMVNPLGRPTAYTQRNERLRDLAIEGNDAELQDQVGAIQTAQNAADDAFDLAQDAINDLIYTQGQLDDAQDDILDQQADINALLAWQSATIFDLIDITNDLADAQADADEALDKAQQAIDDLFDLVTYIGYTFSVFGDFLDNLNFFKNGTSYQTPTAGYINIAHGWGASPGTNGCFVWLIGTDPVMVSLVATNTTYITVFVQDFTGAPWAGTVTIGWRIDNIHGVWP